MVKTLMCSTSVRGLSSFVASTHSAFTAPNTLEHGTGLPIAGSSAAAAASAQVAVVLGARSTDLPGLPPRGAPV